MASTVTLCSGCRSSTFGFRGVAVWPRFEARHFNSVKRFPKPGTQDGGPKRSQYANTSSKPQRKKQGAPFFKVTPFVAPPVIKPGEGVQYFADHVKEWARDAKMKGRLLSFGIPERDLPALLKAFEAAVASNSLSDEEGIERYTLERFCEPMSQRIGISILYSNVFFSWATHPATRELLLSKGVLSSTMDTMNQLVSATNRMFLAEDYSLARKLRRKVIMHVGPTNSGKTYHALRALAAAPTGVYAGPLRLLAHEIWERLNLGQIAPAGSEEPDFKGTDLTQFVDTLPHASAIKMHGNPLYARLCNMITGEEQKMVNENSPLLSCTVEMLPFSTIYSVAVVDEIQMISDPQRGAGWTNAVLGLPARELHLCGEETAVPIIEELLKHTGDDLVIKRYERLTPLAVERESLQGDLKKIQKGDCIVAFSRSDIFAIKRQVEQVAGLRCAIIYGRLPPEIRSEQAGLFNNPDSGYDVLVGSDAIGMGLNLKIRRLVFHTLEKYRGDGGTEKLSTSQVKQIAGRAGRFGVLHGSEPPGGFVTTLEEKDLPYLREALAAPFNTLPFARVGFDFNSFSNIIPALPPNSSTSTVVQAHHFISPLPPKMRYHEADLNMFPAFDFIDKHGGGLTNHERVMYISAPVGWRDPVLVDALKKFMIQTHADGRADLMLVLKTTGLLESLEAVEKARDDDRNARDIFHQLRQMESFHKLLVLYIWLSFRASVLYPEYPLAVSLKERLEAALQWALQALSKERMREKTKKRGVEEKRDAASKDGSEAGASSSRGDHSRPSIPSLSKVQLEVLITQKKAARRLELAP